MEDPLSAVLDVCAQINEHRERVDELLPVKDEVIRQWWEQSGVPKARAGEAIQQAMRAAGWTDEQITRAGVSVHTVKASLDRLRRRP